MAKFINVNGNFINLDAVDFVPGMTHLKLQEPAPFSIVIAGNQVDFGFDNPLSMGEYNKIQDAFISAGFLDTGDWCMVNPERLASAEEVKGFYTLMFFSGASTDASGISDNDPLIDFLNSTQE